MLFGENGTPEIIVDVAFDIDDPNDPLTPTGFRLNFTPLGSATTLDSTIVWVDITDDVLSVRTSRGKDTKDDVTQAGKCSVVVDNWSGNYDPTNLASKFNGGAGVRPMRQLRVRAVWTDSVTGDELEYYLFRGVVEDMNFDFGDRPTVQLECTDALARLAAMKLAEISPEDFNGDTTGARITRVLAAVPWSTDLQDIATGKSTMAPTTYGDTVLALCQKAEEAESGFLYVTPEGKVKFLDRHVQWFYAPALTDQLTLSDDGTGPDYMSLDIEYGVSQVYNEIRVKRVDYGDPQTAVEQVVTDTTSITDNSTRTLSKSDVAVQTDSDAYNLAGFLLAKYKVPELRIRSVQIDALANSDAVWEKLLAMDMMWRFGIERTYGNGVTFTRSLHAIKISHDISVNPPEWRITFGTTDPISGGAFIMDTSHLGDTNSTLVY